MNGNLASNAELLVALARQNSTPAQIVVCVPFPYLRQAQEILAGSQIAWGAQDVSEHANGAYTGEVSVAMLRDCGCSHVIVGHSERRQQHRESSERVARKAATALAGGLTPIVCVGETLEERELNRTDAVVGQQLAAVIDHLGHDIARTVVAYEPVWAIGTGRTATPEQAQAVHRMLRRQLSAVSDAARSVPLLYGGSVKADNADELFACEDIDGGLVGGASLNAREFLAICGLQPAASAGQVKVN